MEDGRIIIVTNTTANLQVYADRVGIQLGGIEDWKTRKPEKQA